ncbi:MAG: helix-turn-helix domain-containing protein [Chitinophagaceae bacterium]
MELEDIRNALIRVLKDNEITQETFARKYKFSSSWLNKFLRKEAKNPRFLTLKRLKKAIESE